jgi:hypothetical protein
MFRPARRIEGAALDALRLTPGCAAAQGDVGADVEAGEGIGRISGSIAFGTSRKPTDNCPSCTSDGFVAPLHLRSQAIARVPQRDRISQRSNSLVAQGEGLTGNRGSHVRHSTVRLPSLREEIARDQDENRIVEEINIDGRLASLVPPWGSGLSTVREPESRVKPTPLSRISSQRGEHGRLAAPFPIPLEGMITAPALQPNAAGNVLMFSTGTIFDFIDEDIFPAGGCTVRIHYGKRPGTPPVIERELNLFVRHIRHLVESFMNRGGSAEELVAYLHSLAAIWSSDRYLIVFANFGGIIAPCNIRIWLMLLWWPYPGVEPQDVAKGIGEPGVQSPAVEDVPREEPPAPAHPRSQEECEEWARRFLAWLRSLGLPVGTRLVRRCGGRVYIFVVGQDGRVSAVHFRRIPGTVIPGLPFGGSSPAPYVRPPAPPPATFTCKPGPPLERRVSRRPGELWSDFRKRLEELDKWAKSAAGVDERGDDDPNARGFYILDGLDRWGAPLPEEAGEDFYERNCHTGRARAWRCEGSCPPGTSCRRAWREDGSPTCDCR